jgi:hypothetical protein
MTILEQLAALGIHKGVFKKAPNGKSQLFPFNTLLVASFILSESETIFCISKITGFQWGVLLEF